MNKRTLTMMLFIGLTTASVGRGGTINSGSADTFANATSARIASTSGTISDDPTPTLGTAGVLTSAADATAGPLDPTVNAPNKPGTTGVSNASADAILNIANGGTIIDADLFAEVDFHSMDGGNYTADSQAEFEVVFSVPADMPYQVTGSFDVDDEDLTWKLQLVGTGGAPGFLINHFSENDALTGPLSVVGTLLAGIEYTYSGRVGVDDVRNGAFGAFNETTQLNATLTIPEPTAVALLGLSGVGLLRRRAGPDGRAIHLPSTEKVWG